MRCHYVTSPISTTIRLWHLTHDIIPLERREGEGDNLISYYVIYLNIKDISSLKSYPVGTHSEGYRCGGVKMTHWHIDIWHLTSVLDTSDCSYSWYHICYHISNCLTGLYLSNWHIVSCTIGGRISDYRQDITSTSYISITFIYRMQYLSRNMLVTAAKPRGRLQRYPDTAKPQHVHYGVGRRSRNKNLVELQSATQQFIPQLINAAALTDLQLHHRDKDVAA